MSLFEVVWIECDRCGAKEEWPAAGWTEQPDLCPACGGDTFKECSDSGQPHTSGYTPSTGSPLNRHRQDPARQ